MEEQPVSPLACPLKGIMDILLFLGTGIGAIGTLMFLIALCVPGGDFLFEYFPASTIYELKAPPSCLPAEVTCRQPEDRVEVLLLAGVHYHYRSKIFAALAGAGSMVAWGLMLFILWRLRQFLRQVAAGRPFDPVCAPLVRSVGLAVLGGYGWVVLMKLGAVFYMRSQLTFQGTPLFPPWWLIWETTEPAVFLAGGVILVIGAILGKGAELQAEHDLTV